MGGRGSSYGKSSGSTTGTAIGASKQEEYKSETTKRAEAKLERLEREFHEAVQAHVGVVTESNGQPMNDKRNAASYFNAVNRTGDKMSRLSEELESQRQRVEALRRQDRNKSLGLNRNGTGLEMSVSNIPRIRETIAMAERGEVGYTKATIKRYKQQLAQLEAAAKTAKSAKPSSSLQHAVDSGAVKQWAKRPNIYFVKGARKVAVELHPDGSLRPSLRYAAYSAEDKAKVNALVDPAYRI